MHGAVVSRGAGRVRDLEILNSSNYSTMFPRLSRGSVLNVTLSLATTRSYGGVGARAAASISRPQHP